MADANVVHMVVTLSEVAEALPVLVEATGRLRWMSIQPGAANADPVYLGGAGVTAANYGARLPAAVAGEPPAPFIIAEFDDGQMYPTDMYFVSTVGEKIHILTLRYK